MSETSRKPIVIIALDDPLATEVAERLPHDVYDVRMAQAREQGKMHADAYEAQKMVEAHSSNPGFVISDEATASDLSGASLTMGAGRKGWHTILRSGSNKSNLRIMADYYLAGEFSGERNVDQIVQFILDRTDDKGQVIPKGQVPEMVRWKSELDEFQSRETAGDKTPDSDAKRQRSQKIGAMVTATVDEIVTGKLPELKSKLDDGKLARAFINKALNDIIHYVDKDGVKLSVLTEEILERIEQKVEKKAKVKTPGELLQEEFNDNPQAFHERAISEVRRRELAGDEPPGATEDFIRHIKEHVDPHFRTPHEQEEQAIWQARERLRAEERQKESGQGWARGGMKRKHVDPEE